MDQGKNFESKLFSSICELLQIHKARTTPYRPSANGQVERYKRTLMDAVRCYIDKAQDHWDGHFAQIAGPLQSAVKRHKRYTANRLMLGREVYTPADLMSSESYVWRCTEGPTCRYIGLRVGLGASGPDGPRDSTLSRLKTLEEQMERDYDFKEFTQLHNLGDLVYVFDKATVKGKCWKLFPSGKDQRFS
jgi:hypothetical protein